MLNHLQNKHKELTRVLNVDVDLRANLQDLPSLIAIFMLAGLVDQLTSSCRCPRIDQEQLTPFL